jgi:hypothetical protein
MELQKMAPASEEAARPGKLWQAVEVESVREVLVQREEQVPHQAALGREARATRERHREAWGLEVSVRRREVSKPRVALVLPEESVQHREAWVRRVRAQPRQQEQQVHRRLEQASEEA